MVQSLSLLESERSVVIDFYKGGISSRAIDWSIWRKKDVVSRLIASRAALRGKRSRGVKRKFMTHLVMLLLLKARTGLYTVPQTKRTERSNGDSPTSISSERPKPILLIS